MPQNAMAYATECMCVCVGGGVPAIKTVTLGQACQVTCTSHCKDALVAAAAAAATAYAAAETCL
jgi:hypothetical protein